MNYGRRVSDHSAVVMTMDRAETDKGQGVFHCGAETHKNKYYQQLIKCSFYKSFLHFMEDLTVQTDLRALVARILSLEMQKINLKIILKLMSNLGMK